jgi:hypothetical protein
VPLDFPKPLNDDCEDSELGGILGSTQRALQELIDAAPLLGIPLRKGKLGGKDAAIFLNEEEESHPYWIERHAWLYFSEGLRESIELGSAVDFG